MEKADFFWFQEKFRPISFLKLKTSRFLELISVSTSISMTFFCTNEQKFDGGNSKKREKPSKKMLE